MKSEEPCGSGDFETMLEVLNVRVQDLLCSIDLQHVERAFFILDLQPVPGGPDYLAGLMNLHGTSIPVLDLGLRLGLMHPQSYHGETPMVLCRNGETRVAFIVDGIPGVETVHSADLQRGASFKESGLPYLSSVNTSHGLSLLLDLETVMSVDMGHTGAVQSHAKPGTIPEALEKKEAP